MSDIARDRWGLPDRFWNKVQRTEKCWLWTASKDAAGYGVFGLGDRSAGTRRAHIVAYVAVYGEAPAGTMLDHRCRNKSCVRPDHLQAVTRSQNMQNLNGPHRDNKSGARNVYWMANRSRWAVQVCADGVKHSGGIYRDLGDAVEAAKELRLAVHTNNLMDREVDA